MVVPFVMIILTILSANYVSITNEASALEKIHKIETLCRPNQHVKTCLRKINDDTN